jgi:hypothetical protein
MSIGDEQIRADVSIAKNRQHTGFLSASVNGDHRVEGMVNGSDLGRGPSF